MGGVDEEISAHQVPNALLFGVNKLYVTIITISNIYVGNSYYSNI